MKFLGTLVLVFSSFFSFSQVDFYWEWAIPPQYEGVRYFFVDGWSSAQQDGKWGIIDTTGRWVMKPVQTEGSIGFYEGLAAFTQSGKWGFINNKAEWVVSPQFDQVGYFREGFVTVKLGEKWGTVDSKGNYLAKPKFQFSKDNKLEYLDGKIAYTSRGDNWGFIDKYGEWVIKPQYESVGKTIREDLIAFKKNGKWGFIDINDNVKIKAVFENVGVYFSNGVTAAKYGGKWGFIDKTGQWVIKPKFENSASFYRDYAIMKSGDKYGYIDKEGNWILQPSYENMGYLANGVVEVKNGGKWGLIDSTGSVLVNPKFEYTMATLDGLIYAQENGKMGLVDRNGNFFQEPYFENTRNFYFGSNNFAAAKKNGKWGYIRKITLKEFLEKKVNQKMEKWLEKDMFESTVQYQNRTAPEKRKNQVDILTTQLIDSLEKKHISRYYDLVVKKDYDADNQTFKMDMKSGIQMFIKVPQPEARSFYESEVIMEKPRYKLNTDKVFELFTVQAKNKSNGKSYTWNSTHDFEFSVTDLAINYKPVDIEIKSTEINKGTISVSKKSLDVGPSDVDVNIPVSEAKNENAIAVIIGNSHYEGDIPDVTYATHDAEIMKEYIEKTFGYKPGNVLFEKDATLSQMKVLFGTEKHQGRLADYIKPGVSDVFVFYSGHGAPDVNTKTGYLMPVNADPRSLAITGYPIETLYNNLAKLEARSVQVVLDACFSGSSGSGKMLIENASPVGIRVSNPAAKIENSIIISASQGDQIASWYPEKGHGLLTYFYLKGLKGDADLDNNGQITSVELQNYLQDKTNGVPYWARRLHGRDQSPEVISVEEIAILGEPKEE